MPFSILPINPQGTARFSFVTELDGVAYTLEFRWNWRDEFWRLHLGDGEGKPLASGLRVVINADLLGFARGRAGWPPGLLVAIDTSKANAEATQQDFGSRVQLVYADASELA